MRKWCVAALLLGVASAEAHAQSAQRLSVQTSGLYANLFGDAFTFLDDGLGVEAQVRYTPSAFSVGAGLQYTRHATAITDVPLTLYGAFVEPRYVLNVGSGTVAPYVSSRLSVLNQRISDDRFEGSSSGFTGNLGGGFLFRLGSRMNLDTGASFGYTNFGDFEITDTSDGSTQSGPGGNGSNVVIRVGLAIGIGR